LEDIVKITLEFDSFEDADAPLVKAVLGTMSGGAATPEPAPKTAEAAPKKAEESKEVQEADLMETAIELASKLMSEGNVRELRNQLSQVGASRVKSMDNEQLRLFIAAVENLDA
jgi:hypothetical protein